MNFVSGGVVEATLEHKAPARPPGIPEHYVFDEEVELWMPPSAIAKAAAVKAAGGATSELQIISSSAAGPNAPYEGNPNDPICFEYTNSGACSRLARGEMCRYRHLPQTHPDVIADKVRQGKLPPEALVAARAGDEERLRQIMVTGNQPAGAAAAQNVPYSVSLMPGMTEADLADPGPSVSLCFDYVNNSACTRLRNGQTCKYRHLPQTHPDVIKDKLRQGKLTPQHKARRTEAVIQNQHLQASRLLPESRDALRPYPTISSSTKATADAAAPGAQWPWPVRPVAPDTASGAARLCRLRCHVQYAGAAGR